MKVTERTTPNLRNLAVYRDRAVAAGHANDGWLCEGERVSVQRVAREIRGEHVLDIGVGGGRTVSFLSLLTDDYVAVDYSPEMVEVARSRYPDADIRTGDVRCLKDFSDGAFRGVFFSFNGIDSIDHEDRPQALAEMTRVLCSGGLLVYSTLNMDGPQFRAGPMRDLTLPRWREVKSQGVSSTLAQFLALAGRIARRVQAVPNWIAVRRLEETHEDWGLSTLEAHKYRLLNHFSTVPAVVAELESCGFEMIQMTGWSGDRIDQDERYFDGNTIYVVARKL